MTRFAQRRFERKVLTHVVLILLVLTTIQSGWARGAQADDGPPQVGEGSLLYRSPVSGRYESVPLLHTDAAIDVRGLVAAATVTQQYANSSAEPIEAVYVFPLPHAAAVYDMEIHIGNRVIRSEIRERQEAKRVYDAAKAAGKRAALLEEERPNIFTTSIANIMPGDHIDVQLRYVEPLRCGWYSRWSSVRATFPARRPLGIPELAGLPIRTPFPTHRGLLPRYAIRKAALVTTSRLLLIWIPASRLNRSNRFLTRLACAVCPTGGSMWNSPLEPPYQTKISSSR